MANHDLSPLVDDGPSPGAPAPERVGTPGETYFAVKGPGPLARLPAGFRVTLDGRDVTNQCDQADAAGGWVRIVEKRRDDAGLIVDVVRRYERGVVTIGRPADA